MVLSGEITDYNLFSSKLLLTCLEYLNRVHALTSALFFQRVSAVIQILIETCGNHQRRQFGLK